MPLNDLEKAAVKVFAKELIDVLLPQLVAAEEARLPAAYAPLAAAVVGALLPALQKALDAKVDAL